MSNFEPTKQHEWLQKLIGNWTYEHDVPAQDGKKATKFTGSETFRAIGDAWVTGEADGAGPDGKPSTSIMTLGYDPAKGRFVGSSIGSSMTNLWVYDGELDANGRMLSLYSDGPAMDGSANTEQYKDVIEFISDDHRTLSGNSKNAEGVWTPFMCVHYRRKK